VYYVSGLLQRASGIRKHLGNDPHPSSPSTSDIEQLGGTEEEQAEILRQIEAAIASQQLELDPSELQVKAKKGGLAIPLLVNLAAFIVVVVGAFILLRTFLGQEQTLVSQVSGVDSAEGILLRRLQQESEAALSEKEAEIRSVQDRLDQIREEREQLAQSIQQQLSEREAALRSEFDDALVAEQARLQGESLTQAEIDAQLEQFRAAQEASLNEQITSIRESADEELASREAELTGRLADAQASLDQAVSERSALEEQLQSDLETQQSLLSDLQQQQAREQLVSDRINSLYRTVEAQLGDGAYESALSTTATLRAYLDDPAVSTLPTVARRRQVELFLVQTLEDRIEAEQAGGGQNRDELAQTAATLTRVSALVQEAERAYGSGQTASARTLYVAALSEIPAVKLGYDRLEELQNQAQQVAESSESDRIAATIRRGNDLYTQGAYRAAADAYGQALLTLPTANTQLLSRILDAGYQLNRSGDIAALQEIEQELADANRSAQSANATVQNQNQQIATLQSEVDRLGSLVESRDQELATARRAAELAASNSDHEALVADLQAEITRLSTDLSDAQVQVAQARSQATSQSATINDQTTQIAALQNRVSALEGQLASSQREVATLESSLASASDALEFYDSQQALASKISQYQRRFAIPATGPPPPDPIALLNVKLTIVRILESDDVRAQYPNLVDQLDEYLDALVAEQKDLALASVLSDVDGILEFLADGSRTVASVSAANAPPGLPADNEDADRFYELLSRLASPTN